MSSYISSNANRFYTALESAYGQVATITAGNRIPALKLTVEQQQEVDGAEGQDGKPDVSGDAAGGAAADELRAADVHDELADAIGGGPVHGPLFQAALGGAPAKFAGGTVASLHGGGRLGFAAAHGLSAGQAVTCGGELRFVAAIVDAEHGAVERAVHGMRRRRARRWARRSTYGPATELPQREHVRLLGRRRRRCRGCCGGGGEPNGHRGERRLPRVSLQRAGAGRAGQQQLLGEAGAAR